MGLPGPLRSALEVLRQKIEARADDGAAEAPGGPSGWLSTLSYKPARSVTPGCSGLLPRSRRNHRPSWRGIRNRL
jgi:hypothetical protein